MTRDTSIVNTRMRQLVIYSVMFHILITPSTTRVVLNQYNINRTRLLEEEEYITIGGSINLTNTEQLANEILMHWKEKELEEAYKNPQYFNLSKHFFHYKKDISRSKVYKIIKKMPKGAALHIHASMMLDADSLLRLTYEDHLYACYTDDDLIFRFSNTVPSQSCTVKWHLLRELRNASNDVTLFDAEIRKYITLFTDDKELLNVDINKTWERFNKIYGTIKSLIRYRPVREKHFYNALQNFYDDNVMYVEIRSGLHGLYELDGSEHDRINLARMYQRVTNKFMEDHPDFIGVKLILTNGRWKNIEQVRESLQIARKLKKEMPDFFAGFDLIGQEDLGKPLKDFLPALLEAKGEIDFYFHGGETNWYGTSTDENLFDAVLLESKRIGHAYALMKHSTLLANILKKNIAIEVNLLSNVVLSLVQDVRNHPLASYISMGLPVVLSSDDPGAWDADPLSHDFYVAFVGVASRHSDLRLLKQLALNSITYSSLEVNLKQRFYEVFKNQWELFVNELIEDDTFEGSSYY